VAVILGGKVEIPASGVVIRCTSVLVGRIEGALFDARMLLESFDGRHSWTIEMALVVEL
jgi:hypothetical protein